MVDIKDRKIAIIGLGYVGLPVAVAFAKRGVVVGYDKKSTRIKELTSGFDRSNEVSRDDLNNPNLMFTDHPEELAKADFYIVAVPTPINHANQPDLSILLAASESIGNHLKPGDIVVYESTVYPGATEEECIPVLEHYSGLKCGEDFNVGYSPERINPGDTEHRFETITKIVSAQNPKTLDIVASTYESVVSAGVFRARNIKTAEAAKVIENTQRDLNIALMNELAVLFDRMGIDTQDVLNAAQTKWNFLPFKPGLVGGHCVGVDPYYLTYQAQQYGYRPEVILAGRRINDNVGKYIAEQTIKQMIHAGCKVKGSRVGILGVTFKENVSDLRNSKVIDIIRELENYGVECLIHGPLANPEEAQFMYKLTLSDWDAVNNLEAIVFAVPHRDYNQYTPADYKQKFNGDGLIIDVKSSLDQAAFKQAGIHIWRL